GAGHSRYASVQRVEEICEPYIDCGPVKVLSRRRYVVEGKRLGPQQRLGYRIEAAKDVPGGQKARNRKDQFAIASPFSPSRLRRFLYLTRHVPPSVIRVIRQNPKSQTPPA